VIAAVVSTVLGGVAILGVVVGWRWLDAQAWRRSLVAMRLRFPRGLKPDDVSAWLGMLGALRVAIALEVVATRNAIIHYLLVPKARRADLLTGTWAVLPGLRLQDASDYLRARPTTWQAATELRITHLSHQLAADRAEATAAAFLGSLGQLEPRETVMIQWLVIGMRTPRLRAASDAARDLARAEKLKHGQPLLQAAGRVAVQTPMRGRAGALLSRITGTLRLLDAPGVAVVRRSMPYWLAAQRLEQRALPVTVWPMAINVREAAGLVGVPLGADVSVPGLTLGRSRQLPPGPVPSGGGTAIAVSNYPGRDGQPLVLRPEDRLRHVYVVGPTGVGKSNLLAQMAIADAAAGAGLALIDPKGDLVETVLERLPEAAAARVIVLDPSRTDTPVGFNPLQVPGADEHARELAATGCCISSRTCTERTGDRGRMTCCELPC
jgi:hypothetical protein